MATATKKAPAPSALEMLGQVPRLLHVMRKTPGVQYLGPCVVQCPGAWTRCGPTWLVPGLGWVVVGPGAETWGTSKGLAEMASADTATSTIHADGVGVVPTPNLAFAMSNVSLRTASAVHKRVVELMSGVPEDGTL